MEILNIILAILAIIVGLIIAYLGTYSLKKNKTQIRKHYVILVFLLTILLLVFLYINISSNKKEQLNNYIAEFQEANFEYENGNYLEAAKIYDKLISKSNEKYLKLRMKYYKANSYEMYGIKNNDNECLENAVPLLKDVIEFDNKVNGIYISKATAELAFVYLTLNNSIYNNDLEQLVKKLLNDYNVDNFKNSDVILEESYFLSQRALSLAMYFEKRANEDPLNKELFESASKYYSEALEFVNYYISLDGEMNDGLKFYKYYISKKNADLLSLKACTNLNSGNEIIYMEKALKAYQDILLEIDRKSDIVSYIRTVKDISKCQIFLSLINADYKQNAYDELIKLLNIDDQGLDKELMSVGYYVVHTGLYEEKDLDNIFSRYERVLQCCSITANKSEFIDIKMQMMTCYLDAGFRNDNISYLNKGSNILSELENQYNAFLTGSDKNNLQFWKEYYEDHKNKMNN